MAPSSSFAVTVAIDRDAQGFVGKVTFARAEQRTVRELQAAGCNELADALAFIVAVLVDPRAGIAPLPPPGERQPPPVYLLPAPAAPPVEARVWFVAGPEVALGTSIVGDSAFGERLYFGLGRGDGSLAMSSARLSLGRLVDHAVSPVSGNRADFALETARLDACFLRVADAGLAFEPCPFFELGRLQAIGNHPDSDVTRHEFWSSLGIVLRPSWTFARRLVLGGGLALQLPLSRYRFAFTGEPELARTPELAFEASLSLGLRFP